MDYNKIRESVNPRVEYIIQACIANWTGRGGTTNATPNDTTNNTTTTPASKSKPTSAPPKPKEPVKKESSSSSGENMDIFGGDDGW